MVEEGALRRTPAAAVLGLALGVAMVKERRAGSIVGSVATAALLATLASAFAGESDLFNPFVAPVYYAIVFGMPVAAGAALGAIWRWALRRRSGNRTQAERRWLAVRRRRGRRA